MACSHNGTIIIVGSGIGGGILADTLANRLPAEAHSGA
jgi:choline dehydrogenase-like flavoprotein